MPTKDIPNRIRQLRKERGLTQAELGARMASDVTDSTIAKLETGRMALTTAYLTDIARALGVDPMDVLGLRGPGTAVRHVPWLDQGQAPQWRLHTGGNQRVIAIPGHIKGENCFAIDATNDIWPRVTSSGGFIVIDPDDRDLVADKLYLVCQGEEVGCVVRQFVTEPTLGLATTGDTPDLLKIGQSPFEIIGRVVYLGFEL